MREEVLQLLVHLLQGSTCSRHLLSQGARVRLQQLLVPPLEVASCCLVGSKILLLVQLAAKQDSSGWQETLLWMEASNSLYQKWGSVCLASHQLQGQEQQHLHFPLEHHATTERAPSHGLKEHQATD